jgi:hypothetical protein
MEDYTQRAVIVSLVPTEISEQKPGLHLANYVIPESDCENPVVFFVQATLYSKYVGEQVGTIALPVSAYELAKSIVNDYKNCQFGVETNAQPGLFYCHVKEFENKKWLENKIEETKVIQKNWFNNLIKIATDQYKEKGKLSAVSDFQRKIAKIMGLTDKDYAWIMERSNEISLNKCIACLEKVDKNAVVCSSCGCILDKERYSKLAFVGKAS